MRRDYTLLKYHMSCNPDYIMGHAIIAGKLATEELKTYKDYMNACNNYGITYYNEELFNKFRGLPAVNTQQTESIPA